MTTERRRQERRHEERERARVFDRIITAEQDERRRLADFLHDTSVQALSGVALMLDGGLHALEEGRVDEARTVIRAALERQRKEIGALRELSFQLEPVVLRDHGFPPAVQELTRRIAVDEDIDFELDVEDASSLAEKAQVALYQILRESLHVAIRRGPPSHMNVRVQSTPDGGVRLTIADDARGERRRATFDAVAQYVRSLNGTVTVEAGADGGTTVSVMLPAYVARG